MTQTAEQREAAVKALGDLVAFLKEHPDVPAPESGNIYAFFLRTDRTAQARFAHLFDVADAFDAPVVEDADGDRKTEIRFGHLTFSVVAQADRAERELRRVVTRPAPLGPEYGECLDERMRSVA